MKQQSACNLFLFLRTFYKYLTLLTHLYFTLDFIYLEAEYLTFTILLSAAWKFSLFMLNLHLKPDLHFQLDTCSNGSKPIVVRPNSLRKHDDRGIQWRTIPFKYSSKKHYSSIKTEIEMYMTWQPCSFYEACCSYFWVSEDNYGK